MKRLHLVCTSALAIGLALIVQGSVAVADETGPMTPAQVAAASADPDVVQGRATMRDPKRDAETLASFTKAAARRNVIGESYLGYLSYMGRGVDQNDRTAADWYRRAANAGYSDAQLRLGLMYLYGRDMGGPGKSIARDDAEGMRWIQRAADGGNPMALDMIADKLQAPFSSKVTAPLLAKNATTTYEQPTKEDVEDLHKAMDLYRRAAAQNDQYAIMALCSQIGFLAQVPDYLFQLCEKKPPFNWNKLFSRVEINGVDPSLLSSDEFPMTPPTYQ